MEQEKDYFGLKAKIGQTPFQSPAVQKAFETWCRVNCTITPCFLQPEIFEQEHPSWSNVFIGRSNGARDLYLPTDLHLWEMIVLAQVIDRDTYRERPWLQESRLKLLSDAGKMFRNAGIYLAARIDNIQEGRLIAEEMAKGFFLYGTRILGEEDKTEELLSDIQSRTLTNEETQQVDGWLAGGKLYRSKLRKIERMAIDNRESAGWDLEEKERREMLIKFFRISDKVFSHQSNSSALLGRVEAGIAEAVEVPRHELTSVIFRRGVEELMQGVKSVSFGKRWVSQLKYCLNEYLYLLHLPTFQPGTLVEEFNIGQLRSDLERVKKEGNTRKITGKELEIAAKIQRIVAEFPGRGALSGGNNPRLILEQQRINCVGATILGGVLMREVGLSYLPVGIPGHALTFLVTSDKRVFWFDLLHPNATTEIINEEGDELTIEDVVDFSLNPSKRSLLMGDWSPEMEKQFLTLDTGDQRYALVMQPEIGEQAGVIHNTSILLWALGSIDEAIELCKEGLFFTPNDPGLYSVLAEELLSRGREDEARDVLVKGISLMPKVDRLYTKLGITLVKLGRYEEAEKAYRQAISLNGRDSNSYDQLGVLLFTTQRNEEGIRMHRRANAAANYALGNLYFQQSKAGNPTGLEDATLAYRAALDTDGEFYYAHYGLARVLLALGYKVEAKSEYDNFMGLADSVKDKEFIDDMNKIFNYSS